MNLFQDFKNKPFIEALQSFFKNLNVPVNEISTAPAKAIDIIGNNSVNSLIDEVYAYGIVNDAIFEQKDTFNNLAQIKSLKADYDGIIIFGITLHPRDNNLLPTRAQLADITRAFSRTFKFTPITIVFKYGNYIAFANSERTQFKQQWREGEKVGKVVYIQEIDEGSQGIRGLSTGLFGYTNNSNVVSGGSQDADTVLSFSKIKLQYRVLARFEIQ